MPHNHTSLTPATFLALYTSPPPPPPPLRRWRRRGREQAIYHQPSIRPFVLRLGGWRKRKGEKDERRGGGYKERGRITKRNEDRGGEEKGGKVGRKDRGREEEDDWVGKKNEGQNVEEGDSVTLHPTQTSTPIFKLI